MDTHFRKLELIFPLKEAEGTCQHISTLWVFVAPPASCMGGNNNTATLSLPRRHCIAMRCNTDVSILHHYICSGQKRLISEFRLIYSVSFIIQLCEQLGIVRLVGLTCRPTGLLTITGTFDLSRSGVLKMSRN